MKKTGKRLCSWLMTMAMGLSVVHIQAPVTVKAAEADKILYECLTISKDNLNKNVIWGESEAYDADNIGLDDAGMFYAEANKNRAEDWNKIDGDRTGGGLDSNGMLIMPDSKVPFKFNWTGDKVYDGDDSVAVVKKNEHEEFALGTTGSYSKLHILAVAGQSGPNIEGFFDFTIKYKDGSEQAIQKRTIYDWFKKTHTVGEGEFYSKIIRIRKKGNNGPWFEGATDAEPYLQHIIIDAMPDKEVESVEFVYTDLNEGDTFNTCIFAVTGEKEFDKKANNGEQVSPDTQIEIGANDFEISIDNAKKALDGDDNILKTLSKVLATEGYKKVDVNDIKMTDTNLEAKPGEYDVTFKYKDVDVTVKATVTKTSIDAHDFIISVEDAKKADKDKVINISDAKGNDKAGNQVDNNNIEIKPEDLDKLKNVNKATELPINISNIIETEEGNIPTTKVKAHVVDETGTDTDKNISIGANNFDIYPEDVQKALDGDTDIIKSFAKVIAIDNGNDVDAKDIILEDAYKTSLKPVSGKYPVTFTYKGVKVTVNANVKVPSIDAHDFIISVDEAKVVTDDIIKDKSEASGLDEDSKSVDNDKLDVGNAVKEIKDSGNKGIPKDIPVVVTNIVNDTKPSKSIIAHVVDETGTDTDNNISIGANNFIISSDNAKKAIDGEDDILKNLSKVLAIEGYRDVSVDKIKVKDKKNLKTDSGDYPITFAYEGAEVTVIATVKVPSIDAHDIIVKVGDNADIDPQRIKIDSDVTVLDDKEKQVDPDKNVEVNEGDLTNLRKVNTPDKVKVELTNTSSNDTQPTTTITAHVVDEVETGNGPDQKEIVIGANNFDISVDDVNKAIEGDKEILKKLSDVVATAAGDNVPTKEINVDGAYKSDLKPVPGKYPVTFTYENVSVTVVATVKDNNGSKPSTNSGDNNKDNGDGEEIAGNDFAVETGSPELTPEDIIKKGNVKAVDGNGTPINLDPKRTVNPKDLENLNKAIDDGHIGTYPVRVTTEEGTPVTINVTVKDKVDNTTDDNKTVTDETISANDFNVSIDDYDRIFGDEPDKSDIIKQSDAKAYLTELKTPVDITDVDTSQVLKKPGTYPVTLKTKKGTSTTINVIIDDKADEEDKGGAGNGDKPADNPKTGITITPADIVYEKTNPQDKTEPVDPAKNIPGTGALKVNGVPVDKYTVSQDKKSLVISKDYLDTLPNGAYQAVITYTDGTEQKFAITVKDYDEATIVKNPPLFSMYKEIVLKKKNTFTINLSGISNYAVVKADITGKGKNAKKVVSIKQKANGDVVITPKKVGKSQVTCTIIQNGAEYKVVVDLKVLKQYKGTSKNYNLKSAGLVKTGGELPEFNVYKRIVKGKNTKIKFTKVEKDAKIKFYVANKKEAKSLKIGKVKRSGKTVTCTIKGKKKGWVHLTAEITQNGKTYYTRLLVRIDDGTWTSKQLKKYL